MPALLRFGLVEPEPIGVEIDVAPHRHRVAARHRRAEAEGPGPLRGLEGGARRDDTREKLETAVGDLQRDAAVVSDSAVAQQSEAALQAIKERVRSRPDRRLPRHPGPRARQAAREPDRAGGAARGRARRRSRQGAARDLPRGSGRGRRARSARACDVCRDAPHDREALTTIRRGFHTLKGSGRMVGLHRAGRDGVAVRAGDEQVAEGREARRRAADRVHRARAQSSFSRLGRRAQGQRRGAHRRRARSRAAPRPSRATQPDERAGSWPSPSRGRARVAAPTRRGRARSKPPCWRRRRGLRARRARSREAPEPEHRRGASTSASPESRLADAGRGASARSSARAEPFERSSSPAGLEPSRAAEPRAELEPVESRDLDAAAATLEPVAREPTARRPRTRPRPRSPTSSSAPSRSPPALFAIYIGEAEQHVGRDRRARWRASRPIRMHPVSADFMRAAHTLASSSRTTGFESLADVATALEKWLADAIDLPPEFDAHRLAAHARRGRRADRDGAVDARTRHAVPARGRDRGARGPARGPARSAPDRRGHAHQDAGRCATRWRRSPSRRPRPSVAPEPPPAPAARARPAPRSPQPAPAEAVAPAPVDARPRRSWSDGRAPGGSDRAARARRRRPARAPAKPFESGKDQRKIMDDVDRDLLPIFLDEAKEIIPRGERGRAPLEGDAPPTIRRSAELQRHLHTLKGSARMTGLMRLGELAHVLEARVNAADEVATPVAQGLRGDRGARRPLLALARAPGARRGHPRGRSRSTSRSRAVFEHQKDKPAALAMMAAAAQEKSRARRAAAGAARGARGAAARERRHDRPLRERGGRAFDRALAHRGRDGGASSARSSTSPTTSRACARSCARSRSPPKARCRARSSSRRSSASTFDPLELDRFSRMQELTRFLAESLGDVITLHQGLQKNLDETELAIHAQARLNRELQQGLMGVRLVPLGNLSDRFYRVVRQTAKELDKKANLELKGTRTELDRSVLEKITGPFEHLLRNAIAHGIETPAERVRARQARDRRDLASTRCSAATRSCSPSPTTAAGSTSRASARRRSRRGCSRPTSSCPRRSSPSSSSSRASPPPTEVSQIAGRGVGMDVVKNEITSLGGRVEIASTAGRGTTFTITLPLTLAVTQAVMLRAGQTIYAVPSVMIEQVQEYKAAALRRAHRQGRGRVEGQPLPAALAAAAAGRDRHRHAGAPDPGAAAEERRAARRDPRGRDHRQPRGRGEDHRPAALAPRRGSPAPPCSATARWC